MPISVNENGVVKPLGSNILYERQIRYIPWHTTYQALTGHDCEVGNLDLFCTVDLSFTPDYVFVKRPTKNAIFFQNDSHNTSNTYNNWFYYANTSDRIAGFHSIIVLTSVHSRHNMSVAEADATFSFSYDTSNVSGATLKSVYIYTGFELIDNTVKCYFNTNQGLSNAAPWIRQGLGFGYDSSSSDAWARVLELDIEAFGNCQPTAI